MKKLLLIIPIFVVLAVRGAFAANYPIGIGPSLMFKAGVNAATIADGYKTGVTFNGLPDFGVSAYFPVSASSPVGAVLDLGYSTYSFGERVVVGDIEGDLYKYQFSYFTISPSLYLSSFILGLDIGLPMSATLVSDGDDIDMTTNNMSTIIEVHIGGMIPVVENDNGRLNVLLRGGYILNGMADDMRGVPSEYNPKAATFGLGLNYYFNLR